MVLRTKSGTAYHLVWLQPNGDIGAMTPNSRPLSVWEASIRSTEAPLGVTYALGVILGACTRTPPTVRKGAEGCDL